MTLPVLAMLVAGPLVLAGLLLAVADRRRVNLVVLVATLAALLAGAIALIVATADGSTFAASIGLWPAGIAIPFVADMFTALMLAATALLTLVCTGFAMASGFAQHRYFAPL